MSGSTENAASGAGAGSTRTDTPLPVSPSTAATGGNSAAKARQADRMISGIDLIDYGAGGLMPNHVYVVKGGLGVGKSILGLQFLARGLEHQEPGILITDQRPENVLQQAKSVGFPLEEAVRRNQLSVLNPSNRYFELVESPADVMAIVDELSDFVKTIGAKRVVIDPIYALINTAYSSHFALSITQSLMNALEDLQATVILVAGDEEDPELNPIIRTLEQNAFGVINLAKDPSTGGRVMSLPKLNYASSENLSAHYRILNGRGLMNYRGDGEQVKDITQPWEETAASNRNVMVLGAQPETIRRVQEALGSSYQVQAEADMRVGVDRVKREKPSLVLVTPSRAAGAVAAIFELAQNSSSSIAFLSPSSHRQADKVLYLRAGADDFITEPFTPAEMRARVDALIRRSGRRLNTRDSGIVSITAEELAALGDQEDSTSTRPRGPVMTSVNQENATFEPEFNERLQRNIATVSKFDTPFAVYWMKASESDADFNQSLAKLCRQEDIICHNRGGEFVAILTGTDAVGVKGFESRLSEKMGEQLSRTRVQRGYRLHQPGEQAQ